MQHSRLLDIVSDLVNTSGKKRRKSIRKAVIGASGDSDLSIQASGGTLKLNDLLGGLTRAKDIHLNELKKQLKITQSRNEVLPAPLYRQEREKIERVAAYESTKEGLTRWDVVVKQNRNADCISFPLQDAAAPLPTVNEYIGNFKPRTRLEIESEKLLNSSKNNLNNKVILTEAEEDILRAMSLEEAKERRAELQKMRSLVSFQAARLKRQKKIKSKGYHRLLKRDRRKKVAKEYEELLLTDPVRASEKLELLEDERIEERATLKHRSTGKWAKQMKHYAKHDPKFQESLTNQLALRKELREKHLIDPDEKESETDVDPYDRIQLEVEKIDLPKIKDNPWMLSTVKRMRKNTNVTNSGTGVEVSKKTSIIRKTFDPELKDELKKERDGVVPDAFRGADELVSTTQIICADVVPSDINRRSKRKKIKKIKQKDNSNIDNDVLNSEPHINDAKPDEMIDPKNYLKAVAKPILQFGSNIIETLDSSDDEDQSALVAEAFADDNVIEEFEKEKAKQTNEGILQDVTLALPGWGDWGGPGNIEVSEEKRKRFLLRAPPPKPRKDGFLPGVILSEADNPLLKKKQLSDLPFPFTSVEQYEASMSYPLGKEWLPQKVHSAFTIPAVKTKMGKIIEPLNREDVFRKKRKRKLSGQSDDEDDNEIAIS